MQGTPGYVDPEYFHSYHLTDENDVYSVGIVLFKLTTSLEALDFEWGAQRYQPGGYGVAFGPNGECGRGYRPPHLLLQEDASDLERIVKEIHGVADLCFALPC